MTEIDQGETGGALARAQRDWQRFEAALAGYLATMTDPGDEDHLLLEVADPDPDGDCGCAPYAQFATCGDGRLLRAEISGNAHLRPGLRLGDDTDAWLRAQGWLGGDPEDDADPEEQNWFVEEPIELDRMASIAAAVVAAMRDHFGVLHPQLLTYRAWGPAAQDSDALGLSATDDVQVEGPDDAVGRGSILEHLALVPESRDDLTRWVGVLLREKYDSDDVEIDDDGDFVLTHLDQPIWICVRSDQPAVEIMTRVAHEVRSRRGTAIEVSLLNRDNMWVCWSLRGRAVWQRLMLPAMPFAPRHLDAMLDVFCAALAEHREDLVLRTGALAG